MESGKFVLRVDSSLHKSLKREASKSGQSLNSLCVAKLAGSSAKGSGGRDWGELLTKIKNSYSPVGVILFGSVARGESTPESDIDLLIVLGPEQVITRDLYSLWDKIMAGDKKYSPQFVHVPKAKEQIGSIWLEASLDGEILLDRENGDAGGELKTLIPHIRREIANGRYTRKESHGQGYWIRQEHNEK